MVPFKVSSYVVDELIDWGRAPDDAIYRLVFPHRDMLDPPDFADVERALHAGEQSTLRAVIDGGYGTNPHPGGQISLNVSQDEDLGGWGLQHKYRETLLVPMCCSPAYMFVERDIGARGPRAPGGVRYSC